MNSYQTPLSQYEAKLEEGSFEENPCSCGEGSPCELGMDAFNEVVGFSVGDRVLLVEERIATKVRDVDVQLSYLVLSIRLKYLSYRFGLYISYDFSVQGKIIELLFLLKFMSLYNNEYSFLLLLGMCSYILHN